MTPLEALLHLHEVGRIQRPALPGMLAHSARLDALLRATERGEQIGWHHTGSWTGHEVTDPRIDDLVVDDPATKGALLALLREATADLTYQPSYVQDRLIERSGWFLAGNRWCVRGASEGEVLGKALVMIATEGP